MAGNRLLRGVAAFKLAAAPVLFGGAKPASAFPVPISGSCYFTSSVVKWYFSYDPNDATQVAWTQPLRDETRLGINGWSSFRREGLIGNNSSGSAALTPVEVASPESGAFKVIRQNGAGGGSTDCNQRIIKIDVSDNDYRFVGAHEIGHAFGLRHTGVKDQLTTMSGMVDAGSQVPLMGVCTRPVGVDYWKARSDDQSSAWYKADTPHSTTADGGFESTGAPVAFALSGGAAPDSVYSYAGDRSMRVPQGGGVGQRVRLTNPVGSALTAGVRFKTNSGTSTSFKLMARTVAYPIWMPQNCDNGISGHQLNNPTPGGWNWSIEQAFGSPGVTWTSKSISLSVDLSSYLGVDVNLTVSNANTEVLWVDSLKVT